MVLDQELVAEGMRLLSRKDLLMPPHGQVAKLRRIAVRAMSDADWREGIPSKQNPRPPKRLNFSPEEDAYIADKRHRAAAAIAAMQALNNQHHLGY